MKTDGAGWDITRRNLQMKKTTTLAILLILMTIVGCKKEYYTISVQSNTPGCLVSGGGSYESGSYISISAIPADGYKFKEWNDGNTNNPRYITVSHDATYIATFEKINGGGGNSSSISAPTGVTASIYEDEEGVFVYVKWNSVSNAVKYNIYYSTSNGSYSNIGSVTSNYCYITNPNTNNYVKVTAVSSNGTESNMSNYAYCSYNGGGGGGGTTAPNAPTGVTATNVGSSSSPQIKISWNSVSNATSYKVYRSSSSSGTYSQLGSATSNTYSYDNNPLSGYNYYKVKAVNSAGESSYSSYAYYNNTGGGGGGTTVPNAPTGVTATNVGTSSSPQIEISWNAVSNATSYKVYRSSSASGSYSLLGSTSSTYKYDYNPMSGYNYYKVKAVNSAGESSYSSYAYYNNTGGGGGGSSYEPCPPTVSVSGTSSQTVSWTPTTGYGCGAPTSYKVYKYDACVSDGNWSLLTTTTSTSYHVSSSNVHPGQNMYAVQAVNSNGTATNYGTSSYVTLSKPSSFSAQKQNNAIKFTWSSVSKATGYQIFMSDAAYGTYYILTQIDGGSTTTYTSYYPYQTGTNYYFKIKAIWNCNSMIEYSDLTSYQVVHF